ncbi:MAG: hydrogenase expression/formation protein HypC [Pseudonocardiales bacterium]|jgi:hydrogenase expression/formation protein HypC|nr:hydrogenase expression/formation protein HypC [Pseudonocardiales bacterium]MDT4920133.1 hydrogenase expression/formation protein HypC [Pseudonocardiales bacterium]MDT4941520.1 hydrogenase expression/formation protein HypC [Pseudonocardiales bacterium]
MCLGLPGRVVSWQTTDRVAGVEIAGVVRNIDMGMLEGPFMPDEYVLVHSGIALERISAERAAELAGLY